MKLKKIRGKNKNASKHNKWKNLGGLKKLREREMRKKDSIESRLRRID